MLDEDFKQLRACIQCGECSAACPSGNWTPIRTRRIMRRAITGIEDVLSDPEIWMCSTCFNCYERCPRNIPVTDVILKLRNIAVREGYLPEALKGVINNLIEYGHAVPIGGTSSKWKELRKAHNLPELPPTVHKYPQALEEISKILLKLQFNKRIPYR